LVEGLEMIPPNTIPIAKKLIGREIEYGRQTYAAKLMRNKELIQELVQESILMLFGKKTQELSLTLFSFF
jgi:hypothetical protein